MAAKLVDNINKEFYKMQIENFAINLMSRVDDILEDWNKGIRSIHIEGDITPSDIPTLKVTKEYMPKQIDLERTNRLEGEKNNA